MNSDLNNSREITPVPQDSFEGLQIDIWEAPFERWMRIADSLLNNSALPHYEVAPKPQIFAAGR